MGIVISSIENKILQNYAKQADLDNSGDLNTREEAGTFISFVKSKEEKTHERYGTAKKDCRKGVLQTVGVATGVGAIVGPMTAISVYKELPDKLRYLGVPALIGAGIGAVVSFLIATPLVQCFGAKPEKSSFKESKALRMEAEELVKDLMVA